jgi:hypothetical protein
MQWHKKTAGIMMAAGVILGGGAAAAYSVHAQDIVSPSSSPIAVAVVQPAPQPVDATDTDNIQDPSGKEQPDAVANQTGKQEVEANDPTEANGKGADDAQEATEKTDRLGKLATLLNMTPADLEAAFKAGTKLTDLATQHGVTQAQLDQFTAAQKQARLDAHKQELAQEVANGKITQAEMDQKLQAMAAHESSEKNGANDPKDANEGSDKNGGSDANEQGGE